MQCGNNVKQIGLAIHGIAESKTYLPPLCVQSASTAGDQLHSPIQLDGPYRGGVGFTVFVWLLPYLEQQRLYDAAIASTAGVMTTVQGKSICGRSIPVYRCGDDPSGTVTGLSRATAGGQNYFAYGNYGANFLVFGDPAKKSTEGNNTFDNIKDGTSNTLVLAERYGTCSSNGDLSSSLTRSCLWADPNPSCRPAFGMNGWYPPTTPYQTCLIFQTAPDWLTQCDTARAQSPHFNGMNVGVADGSVRFLSSNTDATLWANLCDPRDGVALGADW